MLYHVIEHLENPKKAINLLKKKLKVGGTLIIGTPIVETYIQKIFGRFYRQYKKGHIFLFNLDSLKKTLKDQSFTIHKIEKPFFKTKYNTLENFFKLFRINKISPPYYGSIVTVYAKLNDE